MSENFKIRDLICSNGCGAYSTDVWTRKGEQGEIEIKTDNGNIIEAICEKCHSKLEFALTPFNITRKTSESAQKDPDKAKGRPPSIEINCEKPPNKVEIGDTMKAKINGECYEGKITLTFGNSKIGGALTVFDKKTNSDEIN